MVSGCDAECVGAREAARARRPVTSRQRGRSVRRTRRVDRPSTRDTLGRKRRTGHWRWGGETRPGNNHRAWRFRMCSGKRDAGQFGRQAAHGLSEPAARTGIQCVRSPGIAESFLPAMRHRQAQRARRQGPLPVWAETRLRGSVRRRRIGPGRRRRPSLPNPEHPTALDTRSRPPIPTGRNHKDAKGCVFAA